MQDIILNINMTDKLEQEEWLVDSAAPAAEVDNINDTLTTDSRPPLNISVAEDDTPSFYPEGVNRQREDSIAAIVEGSASPNTRRDADGDINIMPSA
jgi:hypothetical protein